ncbi:MAG: T9SS type A sorting domain-containing protein [Leadbetterella sp.]|nr:T9SS type A sorting domain-containing protein [Leadbetterella sp.]
MKKLMVVMALVSLVAMESQAQKEKKSVKKYRIEEKVSPDNPDKKIIKIEKEIDGKVEVIEKEVDIRAPRARVYSFDSSGELETDTLKDGERVMKYGDGFSWEEDFPHLPDRYRRNLNTFKFNMEDLGDRLNRDFQNFNGNFVFTEGFSNVSVFTNKPATHILNLRFRSSEEGPVTISVVNLQGDLVLKEQVKDFSGEYMGQLNLKEGTKGTFFVIIAQGEKGISRKVKVE